MSKTPTSVMRTDEAFIFRSRNPDGSRVLTDELSLVIRDEFISGFDDPYGERRYYTLSQLVDRHAVARMTLYRRAGKEGWEEEKKVALAKIASEISENRIKNMAIGGKKLDDTSLDVSQKLLQKIALRLDDEAKMGDAKRISSSEAKDMSVTALNAQKIGKLALGQAQQISNTNTAEKENETFQKLCERMDKFAIARAESGFEGEGGLAEQSPPLADQTPTKH